MELHGARHALDTRRESDALGERGADDSDHAARECASEITEAVAVGGSEGPRKPMTVTAEREVL